MLEIIDMIINVLIIVVIIGLVIYSFVNKKAYVDVIENILDAFDDWLDSFL